MADIIPIDSSKSRSKIAPRWEATKETQEKALIEAKKLFPQGVFASDHQLEQVYDMGFKLYQSGNYKDAKAYFTLLTMGHIKEPRYMMARAATEHMLKEYYNAVVSYTIAAILDPDSPFPHYHASDCYMKMEDLMNACVALKMTIKRCGENPKFKSMKERCTALLEKVKADLKANKDPKVTRFIKQHAEKKRL